ncbi:MAG: FtsX-like permease family protein [Bacteroidales bacterium]
MLKNYFIAAIRNLQSRKTFAILNIFGLTTGIVSFMIILLYVQYELSFNKHIDNYKNKYRVVEIQNQPGVGDQHVAVTMGPLGSALYNDYPEIVNYTRIMRGYGLTVKYEDRAFTENNFAFADSTVFDMLSADLVKGKKETALTELNSIVLSESLAKKYFENIDDAMGKLLNIRNESYMVTGIMKDYPEESSIYFDALLPMRVMENYFPYLANWNSNSLDTYIQLADNTDHKEFENHMEGFLAKYFPEDWESNIDLYLQPMDEIHLKSGHLKFQTYNHKQGDIKQVYIFSIIAILILFVACINYINLSTSMALKRSKEVGIRKVIGAQRKKLVVQFLSESYIIVVIAALLALIGINLLLPVINNILKISLETDFNNPVFSAGILLTVIILGLASGIYPALYTSSFTPNVIFQGLRTSKGVNQSSRMRKILVVSQFTVSIIILIATLVAVSQVNYFRTADKGYNDEAVYSIPMRFEEDELTQNIDLFKEELSKSTLIKSASAASAYNGVSGTQSRITVADSNRTQLMVRYGFVNPEYFPLMDIELAHGRNFSDKHKLDADGAVILNEIAVKKLGWDEPVGKMMYSPVNDSMHVEVIGVIKDYNYYSLRTPIEPAAYFYFPGRFGEVITKIDGNNLKEGVEKIRTKYNTLFPNEPFEGFFVEEKFESRYTSEIKTIKIFGIFAALCIFISCLGLFGLISFTITQKTKEIAIRKVFGSNVKQIIMVISKEFIMLIIIASMIGIPVAYFYMDNWLNNFAYKISLSWYYFVSAIIIALLIAGLTMFSKVVKASNLNPAQALRDE